MTTFDDQDTELGFFEEPETAESPRRPGRRIRGRTGGGGGLGPRRPPSGTVAVARLAGFVFLAIVVIVGIAAAIGGSPSRQSEYAGYMDSVQPLAQSSARIGSAFAGALAAPNLTLGGFQTRLRQWAQEQQDDYDRAQQLRPPGQLQAAHQEALATFQLRAMGLAGLANILEASKGKDAATVAAQLAGEAQLFSSSDIVWSELFRQPSILTLKTLGVTGVTVPTSQFVTNPDVISSRSFALVFQRLQPASSTTGGGSGSVSGLHGSALVSTVATGGGSTTTLSTSTLSTIPVSQSLEFQVTFSDSGNSSEVNVPVTLKIEVGGQTVFSGKQTVASIQSKQSQTATFSNLNLPNSVFGNTATISVEVGKVPGETNLDNNSATYQAIFSLASGQ
jgi:hypothetical protein